MCLRVALELTMIGMARSKKKEVETDSGDAKKTFREVLGLGDEDKIKSVKLKVKMK